MNGIRWKLACAGLVCAAGWMDVREAGAQSLGAPPTGAGTTSGTPLSGTSMTPIPLTLPIPTPAYATGGASSGYDVAGTPIQGNIFANPFAAPFFYGSMMPGGSSLGTTTSTSTLSSTSTSTTTSGMSSTTTSSARGGPGGLGSMQMGMMMMATQNPNGVGSGVMSGVRPARTQGQAKATAPSTRARTISGPAGLAGRYFNRKSPRSTIPQSYYNRQTRYFP